MDDKRLEDKIDKLHEKLDVLNTSVARLVVVQETESARVATLEADMKPVKRHVDLVEGAGKVAIVLLPALAGLLKALGVF